MAALLAVPGARLGKRAGPGVAGAIGALLFACGNAWWLTHVGAHRHYAPDWLPGMLVGGAGVGLVLPSLTAAAAASLPPARFATGIAIQTTGRQIGSALGVAILVAVLGAGSSPADYRAAWWFMLVAALSAGATLAALGRVPAPSAAAAPEAADVVNVAEAVA
jgi:hypothetical protein